MADYAADLMRYARVDWVYAKPWRVLHAMGEGAADVDLWAYTGVRFACGEKPKGGEAHIPGILSRMHLPRCPGCCAATGLPVGTGSPKNDRQCRAILGLDEPRAEAMTTDEARQQLLAALTLERFGIAPRNSHAKAPSSPAGDTYHPDPTPNPDHAGNGRLRAASIEARRRRAS